MIIKTTCILALAFFTLSGEAQTKRIAHKSHGGSDHSLSLDGTDNFGLGPMQSRTDTLEKKKAVPKKPLPKKTLPAKPKPAPVPVPDYSLVTPEVPADSTRKKQA